MSFLAPLLLALLAFRAVCAQAVTNDLVITAITREGECTTLTWRSHPGEFYRVFWTEAMSDHPFWRVAAFCVPAGGTNTVWSEEGCEGSSMMLLNSGTPEHRSSWL